MILDNIENKFKKNELKGKRRRDRKRKYSYFNKIDQVGNKEITKKQFFDENSIKRTFSKKNDDKIETNNEGKKKLEKRTTPTQMQTYQKKQRTGKYLAAIIKKQSSSIVELKEQVINSKREVLSFDNEKEELGIKQKEKIKKNLQI